MRKSIVVAKAIDGAIGLEGRLPWHLPADLAFFKRLTYGSPIIMGRSTFESIGRVLPGRRSIVLTRNRKYEALEGCTVVHSLQSAFDVASGDGVQEAFVIGGGQVYREALGVVDRLYVTEVHAYVEGDAFFPYIDASIWQEVSRLGYVADSRHEYGYDFVEYVRS